MSYSSCHAWQKAGSNKNDRVCADECVMQLSVVVTLSLLLSGDIETNPGPGNVCMHTYNSCEC